MKHYTKFVLSAFIFLLPLLLLLNYSYADMGPKPTAKITVKYNGFPIIGNFQARMLACTVPSLDYDGSCTTYKAYNCKFNANIKDNLADFDSFLLKDSTNKCYWRENTMAWGGDCTASVCHFNYFLPDQFRLAVKLPNEPNIFVTNTITKTYFDSTYTVNLHADGTGVIKDTSMFLGGTKFKIVLAILITILTEWLFSLFFFKKFILKPAFINPLIIGNIITLPIVWFFSSLSLNSTLYLAALGITELLAFLIESEVYYIFYRKQITPMKLYTFTLIANLLSLMAGLFL